MAFEDARIFLYRVLPWAPLGDPNSFVNIHWSFKRPGFDRAQVAGRACVSIDECISAASWASRKGDTQGVFLCLSTQAQYEEKAYANGGGSYRRAIRGLNTVVQIRSLWIDVDVKEGAYQSHREALIAIHDFFKAASIPRPTMLVNSGGGVHVYWTLNEALSLEQWKPLANALAEATRRFGLICDAGCTVDGARLMRLPDTINIKDGRKPLPVRLSTKTMLPYDYTVAQMQHALSPYMGATVIPLTTKGNRLHAANDELAGGIETPKAPPIDLKTVADAGCGFIGRALTEGGKNYGQPLWNLTTLVSTFAVDGRAQAHAMAAGHPDYTVESTDELFDRKERERTERNLGWPSCRSVEDAGCTSCASCPLKGPGTKPLQFGRTAPTPSAVPPVAGASIIPLGGSQSAAVAPLPHGYSLNAAGHVQKVVVAKDGTSRLVEIAPYEITDPWLQDDPWTFHFKTKLGSTAARTPISVAVAACHSQEGFGKALGTQGIALNVDQLKEFRGFLVAWIQDLKHVKDAVVSSAPFGWSAPHGKIEGFCYGGRMYGTNGLDRPAASPDPVLAQQYTPKGELKPWIEAAEMITSLNSPEREAFIAAGFAGPLVRFTGQPGLLVSAYSTESGIGKSTALEIGQAVWGDPKRGKQSLTDTANSVAGKMGTLRSLPMFWDELKTDTDTNRFVNIAFQLSGGREKTRMNADAKLRSPGAWQTLLMSASNDSLLDHIVRGTKSTTAGVYRCFEYTVPRITNQIATADATQRMLQLNDNYGQAGLIYAKFLGENHKRLHKEVADLQLALENKLNATPDERFWIASMAVLFMGARYSNELGLTKIDLPGLMKFLVAVLNKMRGELSVQPVDMGSSLNVSNVLQQFVGSMRARHMLVTNRVHTGAGKPPKDSIKLVHETNKLEAIYIHHGVDNNIVRIVSTAFRSWLREMGYSPHIICDAMEKKFGLKKVNGRIGGGTQFAALSSEYLLELDLTHPELSKMVNH